MFVPKKSFKVVARGTLCWSSPLGHWWARGTGFKTKGYQKEVLDFGAVLVTRVPKRSPCFWCRFGHIRGCHLAACGGGTSARRVRWLASGCAKGSRCEAKWYQKEVLLFCAFLIPFGVGVGWPVWWPRSRCGRVAVAPRSRSDSSRSRRGRVAVASRSHRVASCRVAVASRRGRVAAVSRSVASRSRLGAIASPSRRVAVASGRRRVASRRGRLSLRRGRVASRR